MPLLPAADSPACWPPVSARPATSSCRVSPAVSMALRTRRHSLLAPSPCSLVALISSTRPRTPVAGPDWRHRLPRLRDASRIPAPCPGLSSTQPHHFGYCAWRYRCRGRAPLGQPDNGPHGLGARPRGDGRPGASPRSTRRRTARPHSPGRHDDHICRGSHRASRADARSAFGLGVAAGPRRATACRPARRHRCPSAAGRGSGPAAGVSNTACRMLPMPSWRCLGLRPQPSDEIARAAGLSIQAAKVALLELALAGRIEQHGGQLVSLAAP